MPAACSVLCAAACFPAASAPMDKPGWDTINRQGRWPKSKVKINKAYLKLSVVTISFFF